MNKFISTISDFYKDKWPSHLSTLISGCLLVFSVWGVRREFDIITQSVFNISILEIFDVLLISYLTGFIFCVFILFIKIKINKYLAVILVSLFIFLFNFTFLIKYVDNEKIAVDSYKKLVIKQMEYLNNDEKKIIQTEIDKIEYERNYMRYEEKKK